MLAREERPFTLEKVFRYADRFTVDPLDTSGDESELYCREKLMKKRVEAITSSSSGTGRFTVLLMANNNNGDNIGYKEQRLYLLHSLSYE